MLRCYLSSKNLYTSNDGPFRGFDGVEWSPISASLIEWLITPFEESEVKQAVSECDGDKAPSPDGYTLKFSKKLGHNLTGSIGGVSRIP